MLEPSFRIQYNPDEVGPVFRRWMISKTSKDFALKSAEEWLLDKDGNMLVDFVAKYENRQADLAYIGKKINCPKLGQERKLVEFTT